MNRQTFSKLMWLLLFMVGSEEFCLGAKAYAGPQDLRAAATAKAAAGKDALDRLGLGSIPRPNAVGAFKTFDVPGSGTSANQGTFPSSIASDGTITGSYVDTNFTGHGFLRTSNGAITTFDVPGAVNGTFPSSINPGDVITGNFVDANFVAHGFVRSGSGAFTTFDAPGAVNGTGGFGINPAGAVVGFFLDANFLPHGFLRAMDGALTTFDAPGAVNGTQPAGINPQGTVIGIFTDASSVNHGFLRASDGTFSTFDVPGGFIRFDAFSAGPILSMSPAGAIAGTYFQPITGNPLGGNFRGFERTPDGAFTTFDAATYPPCCIWSAPSGITPGGNIVGSFNDGRTINHGFLRAKSGVIATFDAPGAGQGYNQGTLPLGVTPGGEIVGLYRDANDVTHGFIFTPTPPTLSAGP
jgi:hypothetical protein